MYLIIEIPFSSDKGYIATLIGAYASRESIAVEVIQSEGKITLIVSEDVEGLEDFLEGLEAVLPASLYLGTSQHSFGEERPRPKPLKQIALPLNMAPCPTCQKEMFDVSSRRYYYPFTACNHCGSQQPFLIHYPYTRVNTSMKFLIPCDACVEERSGNALRLNSPLISCIECGISLRMQDSNSEHLAVDKASYRKLFEVSAMAIARGQSLLMKTAHGYRKFFQTTPQKSSADTILLIAESKALNREFMMVQQEFNALLSIERPLLRLATKSENMKACYGSSAWVKYPDDGMTMLLARELITAGLDFVSYQEGDEESEADFLVDFDLPITPQRDTKLFISQNTKLFITGERIVYPMSVESAVDSLSLAHGLACVEVDGEKIIDSFEHFGEIETASVCILEGEEIETGHSRQIRFPQWRASMLSVLAEHHKIGEKAMGVHFDDNLSFLYYNGREVIEVIPPLPFASDHLWESIRKLREGSDRLVENYRKAYPELYDRLDTLSGDRSIFEVTAIALGLADESLEGISAEALSFLGRGGLQIDTRIKDSRFDHAAFLSSIMSYQLGGVESSLICYGIYESFGDYIGEIVPQLMGRSDATLITLAGEAFANQALYARVQKTLGAKNPLMNKKLFIGKESAVYGAMYL